MHIPKCVYKFAIYIHVLLFLGVGIRGSKNKNSNSKLLEIGIYSRRYCSLDVVINDILINVLQVSLGYQLRNCLQAIVRVDGEIFRVVSGAMLDDYSSGS